MADILTKRWLVTVQYSGFIGNYGVASFDSPKDAENYIQDHQNRNINERYDLVDQEN